MASVTNSDSKVYLSFVMEGDHAVNKSCSDGNTTDSVKLHLQRCILQVNEATKGKYWVMIPLDRSSNGTDRLPFYAKKGETIKEISFLRATIEKVNSLTVEMDLVGIPNIDDCTLIAYCNLIYSPKKPSTFRPGATYNILVEKNDSSSGFDVSIVESEVSAVQKANSNKS